MWNLKELTPEQLPIVRNLFEAPPARLIFESIISGYTSGRAWADLQLADVALIHSDSWILVSGNCNRVQSEVDALLRSSAGDRSYLKILSISAEGEVDSADFLPPSFDTGIKRSMYHECEPPAPPEIDQGLSGYQVQMIDSELLAQPLEYMDRLKDEIDGGWPSQASFVEDGFGFCVTQEESSVVSWCTGEYLSPGRIGIGIETVAGHQRRGLATAIASRFVKNAIESDLRPHWDCWTDNQASAGTAERVGFRNPFVYEVATGAFEKSH